MEHKVRIKQEKIDSVVNLPKSSVTNIYTLLYLELVPDSKAELTP